jgi:hypothetical protein
MNEPDKLPEILKKESRRIFKDFFTMNSKHELNISKNQVNSIHAVLFNNENILKDINANIFSPIEKDIKMVMNDTYSRFKVSKGFQKVIEIFQNEKKKKKSMISVKKSRSRISNDASIQVEKFIKIDSIYTKRYSYEDNNFTKIEKNLEKKKENEIKFKKIENDEINFNDILEDKNDNVENNEDLEFHMNDNDIKIVNVQDEDEYMNEYGSFHEKKNSSSQEKLLVAKKLNIKFNKDIMMEKQPINSLERKSSFPKLQSLKSQDDLNSLQNIHKISSISSINQDEDNDDFKDI